MSDASAEHGLLGEAADGEADRGGPADDRDRLEVGRLLFIAIGVAMLLGFTCGVVWMAYHLLKGYFGA